MGIGDRLKDNSYQPTGNVHSLDGYGLSNKRCPVPFTTDPIEYIEGYLQYNLRPFQREVVKDLFSVDGNGIPVYDVATLIVGMRSGKSLINSVIASFLLHRLLSMEDPAKELGQVSYYKLSGSFIANSEQQSKQTAYASFENIISSSPWWVKYIGWLKDREQHEGRETLFIQTQRRIYFPEKNLEILSLHSNSQSLAGLTAFFVSFEEISRADIVSGAIQDHTEKRSAQAVYYTASRATKSLYPFSKIVVTTSPMYEDDFGMQLLYVSKDFKCGINRSIMDSLRLKYPNKASRMIAYNYASFEANPRTPENPSGFTEESFQMEKISNPTAAMRDFWAIPPNALAPFFEYPEKIDSCINMHHVPVALFEDAYFEETFNTLDKFEIRRYVGKKIFPQKTDKFKRYIICCDQGEVKDSFVVAMGHGEEVLVDVPNSSGIMEKSKRYKIIIDLVEEWKPNKLDRITVSFQNVEESIRILGQNFLVTKVLFDQWNSVESIQRLFSEGLYTERIGATMEMYETLKLLLYSGMVELPNNQKLISELRQLNRVRTSGGREKTEHPPSGCFTGNTRIRLLDGTTPTIKELSDKGSDKEFWIYSCTSDGTIIPAKAYNAHKTKDVKKICRVILDNNEIIECTSDHLFMLRDGSYKKAEDLSNNESLMPLYYNIHTIKYLKGGSGKYAKIINNRTKKWNWVHRYILQYFNGRLGKDEIVHHINFNSLDNTPENLEKLSRSEHAYRHIIANKKIHSKENIKRRNESFKKTYANSEELQKLFKERGKKIFNDPSIRKKAADAWKSKISENKILQRLSTYSKSEEGRAQSRENLKLISKEVLVNNANKLNNIYWKSEKGRARKKELVKTQLVEIRKSFIERQDKEALKKVKDTMNSALCWKHLIKVAGGSSKTWKRRLPNISFRDNSFFLVGKSLDEICELYNTCKPAIIKILRNLGTYTEIVSHNHKVTKVEIIELNNKIPVYDITVPIYENFALESGIFVHNSKDSADAIVRVVWSVYNDSINQGMKDNFILPIVQQFSTIRSAGIYLQSLNGQESSGYDSSIFGTISPSGDDVFGKDFIVKGNVTPNIGR